MLGVSGLMGSSGDGAAVPGAESGGTSGGSSEVGASSSIPGEETERGGAGNRWPRQETLALLKIRSDMDAVFRDSSLKGPLWDEVSRKLSELGFHRSAKKCKEKFENVFKYHKRTKDGRTTKPDGKSYRFFDQLEALENTIVTTPPFNPPPPRPQPPANIAPVVQPTPLNSNPPLPTQITVSSTQNPINSIHSSFQLPSQIPFLQPPPLPVMNNSINAPQIPLSDSISSSSTSSDEDIHRRRGSKRKWKDFFGKLMDDVIQKQEELHKKFLDTLEKRERDRIAREEAWRVQEIARLSSEHDSLVKERSVAAAKDSALIAFLQKVTEQNSQNPVSNIDAVQLPMQVVHVQPSESPPPPPPAAPIVPPLPPPAKLETPKADKGAGDNYLPASSSRWPKAEIQALINLRTSLDLKYHENGPKGPLWEDISSAMGKLGYNRNSKRCKEKWENINKYYKKVKESAKKRPEASKTCPYFHQLEAIYKERSKNDVVVPFNPGYITKPENPIPIMVQPEQQWPQHDQLHDPVMHDQDNNNEDEDFDDDDDEEEDEGGGYEIVANKKQKNTVERERNVLGVGDVENGG